MENEKLIDNMKRNMEELKNEYDKKIKRIEEKINNDNAMEKSDAYKMYQEPSKVVSQLLDELKEAREQARENAYLLVKAQKQIEKLEARARVADSLQATIDEAARKAHDLYYILTD